MTRDSNLVETGGLGAGTAWSFLIGFILLVAACGSAPTHGALSSTEVANPYLRPQRLVDVGGGRRLNIYCVGSGSPTVVFDGGLSSTSLTWTFVQPAIGKRTRACAYDRAGLGFSDASSRAGTSANIVEDLHTLLRAAGERGPYVLVGHSFSGVNARLFASTYPGEVAGLVLVDPSHEDQAQRLEAAFGGPDRRAAARLEQYRKCAAAPPETLTVGGTMFDTCVVRTGELFGPGTESTVVELQGRAAFQKAQLSEFENVQNGVSAGQMRAARRSLGAMPLIVLTRGTDPAPSPPPTNNPNETIQRQLWIMHSEIAASSTRGVHRGVPGSEHDIQLDKPEAVIAAVNEVLDTLATSLAPGASRS